MCVEVSEYVPDHVGSLCVAKSKVAHWYYPRYGFAIERIVGISFEILDVYSVKLLFVAFNEVHADGVSGPLPDVPDCFLHSHN